jgi:hypothetical protein
MTDAEIADAVVAAMDPNAGNVCRAVLDAIRRTRLDDSERAVLQSRRYDCRNMKGICRAIADQIKRASDE